MSPRGDEFRETVTSGLLNGDKASLVMTRCHGEAEAVMTGINPGGRRPHTGTKEEEEQEAFALHRRSDSHQTWFGGFETLNFYWTRENVTEEWSCWFFLFHEGRKRWHIITSVVFEARWATSHKATAYSTWTSVCSYSIRTRVCSYSTWIRVCSIP